MVRIVKQYVVTAAVVTVCRSHEHLHILTLINMTTAFTAAIRYYHTYCYWHHMYGSMLNNVHTICYMGPVVKYRTLS